MRRAPPPATRARESGAAAIDDAVANRDDFLGMVAHDVRNLLNLVGLSLELLRPGDEEGKTGLITKTRPKTKKPSLYKVLKLMGLPTDSGVSFMKSSIDGPCP